MQKSSKKGSAAEGAGIFAIAIGLIWAIIDLSVHTQFQSYQAGQCTIIAKQLAQTDQSNYIPTSPPIIESYTTYDPNLQFTLQTADGRRYQTHGYAFVSSGSPDYNQEEGQAVIDQFQVGSSYQCWYDPANPSNAILDHTYRWDIRAEAIIVIGLICLLVGFIQASRAK